MGEEAEDPFASAGLLPLLYETLEKPDVWAEFPCRVAAIFDARGARDIPENVPDFRLSFTKASGYGWSRDTYAACAALIPKDPRRALVLELLLGPDA